jgi:hypothetical protein
MMNGKPLSLYANPTTQKFFAEKGSKKDNMSKKLNRVIERYSYLLNSEKVSLEESELKELKEIFPDFINRSTFSAFDTIAENELTNLNLVQKVKNMSLAEKLSLVDQLENFDA